MKLLKKTKFQKDGKIIKKYKLFGVSVLRKEILPFKKKWNLLGIKFCKKTISDTKFPFRAKIIEKEFVLNSTKGRTVVFAMFSDDGTIPDTTIYYLKGLKNIAHNIILIADNPIFKSEIDKVKDLVCYCCFERHKEYDFGSYKRGYLWAKNKGILDNTTELIFCNDSCYGPVFPFSEMFDDMEGRKVDFWGICANKTIRYHLQSYFLVFNYSVFTSTVFVDFIKSIKKEKNYIDIILKYETQLTELLSNSGFVYDSYIKYDKYSDEYPYLYQSNQTKFPLWLLNQRCPVVKVKALNLFSSNYEGLNKTIDILVDCNSFFECLTKKKTLEIDDVKFSIIMPTFNRGGFISKAINSCLAQTHQNFELIIVDDGSTDGTKEFIENSYKKEIEEGKIKYFYKNNEGVCKARNYALERAKNEWIAYLDSDNILYPNYLESFAYNIINNKAKVFYCRLKRMSDKSILGQQFDFNKLLLGNYIDMGTFVHHNSLYKEQGGFDENMTRLCDWELIVRYVKSYKPTFINLDLLLYNDIDDHVRISNSANYFKNLFYFRKKHCSQMSFVSSLSVIVPIYNALSDVKKLLESLKSNFNFFLGDVTLINDCSNNDVFEYLNDYCKKNPEFKLVSNVENVGFIKSCNRGILETKGDVVVLLNSDTKIPTEFCERILKCFNSDEKIGVASPIGSYTLKYYIPIPNDTYTEQMNDIVRKYHKCFYPVVASCEGFCFCIRRKVIEEQGGLDEVYGKGYHEEVDFSYRAIKNGWKNVLIDDLYVFHKRHASFGVAQREELIAKNNIVFHKRWDGFINNYVKKMD